MSIEEGGAARRLRRVVCADDEEDILQVVSLSLQMLSDLEVVPCTSGAEALALARSRNPDLLLLDMLMPGIDGATALREIRNDPQLADLPVVLMTARVQPHEIDAYMALGATGVISKPFDPMTLADELLQIWTKHSARGGDGAASAP